MSEWDFLWDLSGQELEDAMTSGATYAEWNDIQQELDRELIGTHAANVFVFIDGENIPAKYHDQIKSHIDWLVDQHNSKVYARQKDAATLKWHLVAQKNPDQLREIRLSGGPEKNKVDKKIIKDMKSVVRACNPAETTIILVSSDSDFRSTVAQFKEQGIRVIGIGEEKAPDRLRSAFDRFFTIFPEIYEYDEEENFDHIPPPAWFVGGSDAYRYQQ